MVFFVLLSNGTGFFFVLIIVTVQRKLKTIQ